MASAEEGIQSQIRNIEERYGRPIVDWIELIRASGLTKYTEVVAFLKSEHGMNHGAAHRVSLTARQASEPQPVSAEGFVDGLYAGRKAGLRPVHDELIRAVTSLGTDVSLVPKKGYISLRRNKQFAMIQPSTATRIDVGLILRSEIERDERLEPTAGFNALFTHRVRVQSVADLDAQLRRGLEDAYQAA
jgi:Domain of unknown function (DUF4287)/Domain of unknown function (DUF5655)